MDDSFQAIKRVVGSSPHCGLDNHGQFGSHIGQNCLNEVVLRGEPIQQCLLGDTDFCRNLIEANRVKTPGPEQNRGTFQNALTGISASMWAHWATGHSLFLPAHPSKNPKFLRILDQLVENRVITES
jgi:hypothetical protein